MLIDEKGRLFGRLNIIDLSLVIIILAVGSGLFWVKRGNTPLDKMILSKGQAEIVVAIRGARVSHPEEVFKSGEPAFVTIRNQRYKKLNVEKAEFWQRKITLMGTDGNPVSIPDPSHPDIIDINLTLSHEAERTEESIVMGGHHLKVGNSIELDAFDYRFRGTIMQVTMEDTP